MILVLILCFPWPCAASEDVLETYLQLSRHKLAQVRANAMEGLASLRDARAVPTLLERLGDDREIGRKAMRALLRTPGCPPLRELAARCRAANAWEPLQELKDPGALPHLLAALSSAREDDRYQAMEYIGSMKSPQALDACLSALEDPSPIVADRAIVAVARGGDELVWRAFLAIFSSWDGRMLGRLSPIPGHSFETLVEFPFEGEKSRIHSPLDSRVSVPYRAAPGGVSFYVVAHRLLPLLEAALETNPGWMRFLHADPSIRDTARSVWMQLFEGPFGRGLWRCLLEESWPVRVAASKILGREGLIESDQMIRILADPDVRIRQLGAEILAQRTERPPDTLLAQLLEALRREPGRLRAQLDQSREHPGTFRPVLEQQGLDQGVSGASDTFQVRAIRLLGRHRWGPAFPVIVEGLQGPRRSACAKSLADLGDPRAVEPLIAAAHLAVGYTADGDVLEALQRMVHPGAVRALVAGLAGSVEVRGAVIEALVAIGDPSTSDVFMTALEDSRIREPAARGLARIHSIAPPILYQKLKDPDINRRLGAAMALGWIRDPGAVAPLTDAMHDPEVSVRGEAAVALGRIGDSRGIEPLIQGLEDKLGYVTGRAERALITIGDPAIPRMMELLMSARPELASSVTTVLTASGARVVPQLLEAGKQTGAAYEIVLAIGKPAVGARLAVEIEPRLRASWIGLLGRIGDPVAAPAVARHLEDPDPEVRRAAVSTLGALKDPATVTLLTPLLRDGIPAIRLAAVEAVASSGDPGSVEDLLGLLEDPDEKVRRLVVTGLGKARDPRAGPALARLLGDEDPSLVKAALQALGEIPVPEAVPQLARFFEDGSLERLPGTGRALGKAGGDEATRILIEALQSPEARSRDAAVEGLLVLEDPRGAPRLLAALESASRPAREHLAAALGRVGDARCLEPLARAMLVSLRDDPNKPDVLNRPYMAANQAMIDIGSRQQAH